MKPKGTNIGWDEAELEKQGKVTIEDIELARASAPKKARQFLQAGTYERKVLVDKPEGT